MRNTQIAATILREYGIQFDSDTIAECLLSLIRAGKVLSMPVKAAPGKTCDEYWWISVAVRKKPVVPMSLFQLIDKCIEAAKTYPDEHVEVKKIMFQIDLLKALERKVA